MQGGQVSTRWEYVWLRVLVLLTIVTPIVWLEVDPSCSAPGRSNVPDIWILGGYIFGKDIFWPGIFYAWIAQCIGISLFYLLVELASRFRNKSVVRSAFMIPAMLLLTIFPVWMYFYTEGVIHNSDGVCLITHLGPGWVLYAGIWYLTLRCSNL